MVAAAYMIVSMLEDKGQKLYREVEKSYRSRRSWSRSRNQSLSVSAADTMSLFITFTPNAQLRRHERYPACSYRMTSRGESGIEFGVPGKIIDGDPSLEYSNECECDKGGV